MGAIILFESMVTDAADADRLESGEERSGLYFGYWRMGQKLARSVGLGLTGWITWLIGFEAQAAEQPAQVARSLAYVFGPGVGVFFVAAALIFARSPLKQRKADGYSESIAQNRCSLRWRSAIFLNVQNITILTSFTDLVGWRNEQQEVLSTTAGSPGCGAPPIFPGGAKKRRGRGGGGRRWRRCARLCARRQRLRGWRC